MITRMFDHVARPRTIACAIVLACEDPEAFRPLSYSLAPALLPVGGVPALERVLRAVTAAGARKIVVIADHRFHELHAWLEVLTRAADLDAEVSLAHADQFAAAPLRLGAEEASADPVLVCGWNALWLERGLPAWPETSARVLGCSLRAPGNGRPDTVCSAVLTDLATLAACAAILHETLESEPPARWLEALLVAARTRGESCEVHELTAPQPVLDGLGSWRRSHAGYGDRLAVDPTARVAGGVSLHTPSVLCGGVRVESGAAIDTCILLDGSAVGADSRLTDVVLGPGDAVPPGARLAHACLHRGELFPLERGALKTARDGRPRRGRRLLEENASRLARRKKKKAAPSPDGMLDTEQVTGLVRRLLGRAESPEARYLASGFQNKVCRTGDVIVKWAVKGDPQPLWVEHHALEQVREDEISPHPWFLDLRCDPFPYPVLVCAALPGSELRTADLRPEMLHPMGRLLRRAHAHDGEALWDALPTFPSFGFGDLGDYMTDTVDMFRYYARYREDVGLKDDALMAALYHCVENLLQFVEESTSLWASWGSAQWPLKLCHGDLVPHNFMYDAASQGLWLIDWERAGVGDPAYELAWFSALNQLAGEHEEAFLSGYFGAPTAQLVDAGNDPASAAAQLSRIQAYRKVTAMSWPIQILAYQARYWKERFPVTMEPAEYVDFNLREAYRRLADGFTWLGRDLGGWRASARQLEEMGTLLVRP